jgi:hypothetical protein
MEENPDEAKKENPRSVSNGCDVHVHSDAGDKKVKGNWVRKTKVTIGFVLLDTQEHRHSHPESPHPFPLGSTSKISETIPLAILEAPTNSSLRNGEKERARPMNVAMVSLGQG